MFFGTLTVVAEKAGVSVIKVNPAYTSKVLSYRNEIVFDDVSIREYFDEELGLTIDRDVNAALNIKQRGLQVYPLPKKTRKQGKIKIVRDLDNSIVTAMINVFKSMNQAHVHNL